ncbi:MAG: methyltransferase domain-containing protein [Deltaproteobacteria bacterium]|nr:methyltransferase domain-containing protein [Deltaproteobacteria bacterium]
MPRLDLDVLERLLEVHAPFRALPFVPELACWHASNELPLWEALEAAVGREVPPPFFALAWPAGQAVARLILDGRLEVAGRRVADVGCGAGVVALAAAMRGAEVLALDVDPLALDACVLAARRHGLTLRTECRDAFTAPETLDVDVVLAADLLYHRSQIEPGLRALATWRRARHVVLADGGRPHFDAVDPSALALKVLAEVEVPAERIVEGAASRTVRIFEAREEANAGP